MKALVLIVEDEIEIAELIKLYLENEGFTALHAETAEAAADILNQQAVDIIVLDINLPGMDGFEFLQMIRKNYMLPVVIVSARQDDADIILGLGIGADDYVTKPFSPKVLAARVRANLRRASEIEKIHDERKQVVKVSSLTVDRDAYLIRKGENRVAVSPREFELFIYLIDNAGVPKTPEEIYSAVWGTNFGDITTVAVHIQRLRKKLEDNPAEPGIIETVHGLGYRIKKELIA